MNKRKSSWEKIIEDLALIIKQDEQKFIRWENEPNEVLLCLSGDKLEVYDMNNHEDRLSLMKRIFDFVYNEDMKSS